MPALDYDNTQKKDPNNTQLPQPTTILSQSQQLNPAIPKIRTGSMLTDSMLQEEIFQQTVTQEDLQMIEKLKILNGIPTVPKQIVGENEIKCLLHIKSMADNAIKQYFPQNQSHPNTEILNTGLQPFHFSKYNAEMKNPQIECLLIGLRMRLKNPDNTLKQPQKNDIVDYLANSFLSYNKTNPYKNDGETQLANWLKQIQNFFSWTASRSTYRNIAGDILIQEIVDRSVVISEQKKAAEEQAKVESMARSMAKARVRANRKAQKRQDTWEKSREKERLKEKLKEEREVAAAEEEESEPEIEEIEPQSIDPKWTQKFIENIKGKTERKHYDSIKAMMDMLRCYLIEYNINKINRLSMLKFMALYKDVYTFGSIQTNNSTLKRFFRWTSSEEAPEGVTAIENIDALVPTYKSIIQFKRKTRKEGNERLNKASFNYNWLEQFISDIERTESFKSLRIPVSHINCLQKYLSKKVRSHKPMPSDILDLLILEKSNIAEESIFSYLSTYQKLFKWTSIKTNRLGNMYYPNIIGGTLQRGILSQLITILKKEYDQSEEKPDHPTAKYFEDFQKTIQKPYDGKKAIDFENFIKYLQKRFNIQTDNTSSNKDLNV